MFQATAGSVALLGLLALSIVPSPAAEEVPDPWQTEGVYESCRNLTRPQPNLLLPAEVPAPAGELTCHADFKSAGNGWIRIYLVNRTSTPGEIGKINGSPEFKAHRKLPDGTWEVVQPRVKSVWCADSFRTETIHPGMFVSFEAKYHPPCENAATIRYEYEASLVSNEGPGFWDPNERDIANSPYQADALTLFGDSFLFERQDLTERPVIERKVAQLDLQMRYRTTRSCQLLCDHLLSLSEKLPDDWRAAAQTRLSELKNRTGAAMSDAEFAAHCLNTMEQPRKDWVFGSPAAYPDLCWQALATLGRETENQEELPWDRLFGVMESRFPAADFEELGGMARVLGQERYVH
ncbi:MAG: hypothetical protein H7A50_17090, partial [Akkermansiaceae bacterium]|nr:hypothetical protein [Akkermansiaceae bacterium]